MRRKRRVIISVIVLLVFFAALMGNGFWEQKENRLSKTAEDRLPGTVPVDGGAEWEWWTDCLFSATEEAPYAYAVARIDDTNIEAKLSWGFYEDREGLLKAFYEEKAALQGKKETEGLACFFLKMQMDETVHGLDIYEYLQQNLAEEDYIYTAMTLDNGRAYVIEQEWEEGYEQRGELYPKREVLIRGGYLYYFECGKVDEENREDVRHHILCWEGYYTHQNKSGWVMDEEDLYWVDHTERMQSFTNPGRAFSEVRAVDLTWPDQIMGYFALMSEAEYQVQLAPNMPELSISFQFLEEIPKEGYETYLWNGSVMDEPYRMEVRTAEDLRLLQTENVNLNIDYIDTILFEDLDEDGYLDMKISYLEYFSGYDGRDAVDEKYWLWNVSEEKFEKETAETVQQRRKENRAHLQEEPTETYAGTYTVQKGDSLWRIAERCYGNGARWVEIYEKNRARIGGNPSRIFAGMELAL